MDRYKYSVELRYIKQKENISEEIKSNRIHSIIIDYDYIENNLPVIFMNITLKKKMIDDMLLHENENTIVLTIYKYIYRENKLTTKARYIQHEMKYFLPDDLNYRGSIDYSDEENENREDLQKQIQIGLMGLDSINNNKRSINTVLRYTSMINAVHYMTSHIKMVIEKFDYNKILKELIISPRSTTSKNIEFLNSINVFYKTPYRFFIDFDCGYLLASSGKGTYKKGETINSVLIVIRDPLHPQAMQEGMITNYDSRNYQLDVSAADTRVTPNKTTEKVYTSVASMSEVGKTVPNKLKLAINKYSKENTEVIRTPSSNPNLIKNIVASNNQTANRISLNKVDVDVSVFTPNKEYTIKNFDEHKDKDGTFILLRKRELFYFEAEDMFTGNAMLELAQIIKE